MKTKAEKIGYFNGIADVRDGWKRRNAYYHRSVEELVASIIPPGRSVLEIGCGTGDVLAALRPSHGVGVDFSERMVARARTKYPQLKFVVGDADALPLRGPFDFVVLSDLVGELTDVWQTFRELNGVVGPHTRIVVTYYSYLWEVVLKLGERVGLKMPQDYQNWLSVPDLENLAFLSGLERVRRGSAVLFPVYIPGVSRFLNGVVARLPGVKRLCLTSFLVARPMPESAARRDLSCSVIVPCRNEVGNIENTVRRMPALGYETEIVFVDGASTDGTVEKIHEMMERYAGARTIRLVHQVPRDAPAAEREQALPSSPTKMLRLGKGDAVRKGFEAAKGDVLVILDSDLTVVPEDLPKFYLALADGRGELINGSRLVYQPEKQAMRTLNLVANKLFGVLFSYLLEQRITDTLCGTKALLRRDWERVRETSAALRVFDPFGDFDLLFGAAQANLKIVEVPVRYFERTYGDIKIERFKHGWLLLRMCWKAFLIFKLGRRWQWRDGR